MKKRQLFFLFLDCSRECVFTGDQNPYMLLQVNMKSKSTLFALIRVPGLMGMIH